MKKLITMFIAAAAIMIACGINGKAADAAAKIQKVEYEGNGRVDVSFFTDVEYGNLKVKVTDSKGRKVKSEIISTDDDDFEFRIKKYKQGKTYKFKISGVRQWGTTQYKTLKGKVTIPKASGSIPVKKVEYDHYDGEVSFEFDTRVIWSSSPKVTISNGSTQYVTNIGERDSEEIEVFVKQLKKGTTYKYTISGVKKSTGKSYTTVSGSFKA